MEVVKVDSLGVALDAPMFRVYVVLEDWEGFPNSMITDDIERLYASSQTRVSITIFARDELDAYQRARSLVRKYDD